MDAVRASKSDAGVRRLKRGYQQHRLLAAAWTVGAMRQALASRQVGIGCTATVGVWGVGAMRQAIAPQQVCQYVDSCDY